MNKFIIDPSIIISNLFNGPHQTIAQGILRDIEGKGIQCIVPDFFYHDLNMQTLKLLNKGLIGPKLAQATLDYAFELPLIALTAEKNTVLTAHNLALSEKIEANRTVYIALAMQEGLKLATFIETLRKYAKDHNLLYEGFELPFTTSARDHYQHG